MSPDGAGLYPHLRQKLAHRAGQLGKTVTLFERLPKDDPAEFDYERAKRMAEGWQVMGWEHPDFQAVERSKRNMPLSNGGHPQKPASARRRVTIPRSLSCTAPSAFGNAFPFRDPAYSLGR